MPKKHRVSTTNIGIPQRPTANIGLTLRKELELTPEVFDNITTAHVAPLLLSNVSANTPPQDLIENTLQKERSKKKKNKTEITVQITGDNEIYDHESELLQNFTESTGTYSYDSPLSVESFCELSNIGKLVESRPLKCLKAEIFLTEPKIKNEKPILTQIVALDKQRLINLVTSENAPQFGEFEPISAQKIKAIKHRNFVEQIINKAMVDFFDAPRDDLILNVKIRRKGLHPILNIELEQLFDKANKASKKRSKAVNTIVLYEDEEFNNDNKAFRKKRKSSKTASTKNSGSFFNSVYNYFNTLFQFKENNSPIIEPSNQEKLQTTTSSTSNISTSDTNTSVDGNCSAEPLSDSSIKPIKKAKKKSSGRKKKR